MCEAPVTCGAGTILDPIANQCIVDTVNDDDDDGDDNDDEEEDDEDEDD